VIEIEHCKVKALSLLSRRVSSVRTVLMMGRRRHRRLVHIVSFLWRIGLKHDASLRRVGSEWTWGRLARMWEVLGVLGTAHEE
jgi:hypothetical protein